MPTILTVVACSFAVVGCSFQGANGLPDNEPSNSTDAGVDVDGRGPAKNEFHAAHIPVSGWGLGDGSFVVNGEMTIDTSEPLSLAGLPNGALFNSLFQEGAPNEKDEFKAVLLRVGHFEVAPEAKLIVKGPRPLVIVSATDIVVAGEIDASASGTDSGPGGVRLGRGQNFNNDLDVGNRSGGGGGGSFGSVGGDGGTGNSRSFPFTAKGGSIYGDDNQEFLFGGSRGGKGKEVSCDANPGGGGGGVQLSARSSIHIKASGSVHANGGGGAGGRQCLLGQTSGGGGGGSGGAIYLEGTTVVIDGQLTANGGGGGAGNVGQPGEDGNASDVGKGGASDEESDNSRAGGDGATGTSAATKGDSDSKGKINAGGGGGGVGRIRIHSVASNVSMNSSKISPAPIVGP